MTPDPFAHYYPGYTYTPNESLSNLQASSDCRSTRFCTPSNPAAPRRSSTSEAIVTGTDFYPTLLEMMNLPAVPDQHVDGKSFVPALNGEAYERGPVYWHFPHYSNHGYQSPGGAIRSGDFKLLEYYENGTVQLFDLANDIGERNDLAEERPEVVARLKKQFEDWRDEVDAKMPYPKTATSKPARGARVAKPRVKDK